VSGARVRLLPQPITSAVLLIAWLLAQNSVAPGQLLLGAALAVAIPRFTHRFWPEYPRTVRFVPLLRLAGVVLLDIVVANVVVAALILGPARRRRPRFITVPLALTTPYAVTLLASIISLTPGTVSSELDEARRTLLVHGLDVADEAAAVARIKQRYEAPLREIFEC